jgi:hypothetical protein
MDQFNRAQHLAHRYFQDLVGDYYGVRWIEVYRLQTHAFAGSPQNDLYPEGRELTKLDHPFHFDYARRFYSMLIEPPIYLNAVMRDFLLAGGKIVVREFRDPAAIAALPEPVIVNCTGLGSRELFHDTELTPIKGQLTFLLPQPEVDYMVLAGGLYMFPRRDGILLGGTHERGVWSPDPDPEASVAILKGHMKIFAEMR